MNLQDPMLTDLGNDLRDSFWTMVTEELGLPGRAEHGATGMDRIYPLTHPGGRWWQQIDLDRLNLYDGDNCIVGQLYGPWEEMIEQVVRALTGDGLNGVLLNFDMTDAYAATYGLVIPNDVIGRLAAKHKIDKRHDLHRHAYVILTDLWRKEIEKRRAA